MTRAARAAFVLLVGATFGAFFVAQSLKAAPAVLDVKKLPKFFSPNGDGTRDVEPISFTIRKSDDVTVSIVDDGGDEVRRLVDAQPLRAYAFKRVLWDGRTDAGTRASDGTYRLRIGLRKEGRSATYTKPILLDTVPPTPTLTLAHKRDPHVIGPVARPVALRLKGAGRRKVPHFRVWRTDLPTAQVVREFDGARSSRRAIWDGKDADGALVPVGTYLVEAVVQDAAGNQGSSAPGLPQRPRAIHGTAGITVRGIGAVPPGASAFGPVHAGTQMRVFVDARGKPYSWALRRLGSKRPRSRGRGKGALLKLTAPRGKTGVYLLELRARRFNTRVPFLVQSDATTRLLVVVPALSWVGADRVDDNGDGYPDTLETGGPVTAKRVLVGDEGLPAGFARDVAPLLVLLDRAKVTYDVTTDLALMRGEALTPDANPGVLLAGPFRWIPRRVARRLRDYVSAGGRLASFGGETLRRSVAVERGKLVRPAQPTPDDPFGVRLEKLRHTDAPAGMETFLGANALNLLIGTDGRLDGFSLFEESAPPSDEKRLLVSVGVPIPDAVLQKADAEGTLPPEPKPALTTTKLGDGLVIRVGLPEWPARIGKDGEVVQVTRNIFDVLRGVAPKLRGPL